VEKVLRVGTNRGQIGEEPGDRAEWSKNNKQVVNDLLTVCQHRCGKKNEAVARKRGNF